MKHLYGQGCPKCFMSKCEFKINYILSKLNISVITQKKFNDCHSHNNIPLRFDFYLPDYNICIEYDGEQHSKPVEYFGGIEGFDKLKINDNIKNEYCL